MPAVQRRESQICLSPEAISSFEFHSDDFGLFPAQSKRILDCYLKGVLNGVSVMPNSEYLAECMALLRPYENAIEVTVHLNLIEGRCLCSPSELSLLVDGKGIFRVSFVSLLLHSYLPDREAYKEQLKKEIRAQVFAVKAILPQEAGIRIDGHAHYHMLPVVFDALMEVIREDQLKVSYIRIPREYLSLYVRNGRQLHNISAINLMKVLVLNCLSTRNEKKHSAFLNQLTKKVFLGVFLSGHMDLQNVVPLLPDAIRLAKKLHCGLEILAHPGGVYEKADIEKLTNADDIAFLTSQLRNKELEMFQSVSTELPGNSDV